MYFLMQLNGKIMEYFLKNVETKVIILNAYVIPNETMYINTCMFQMSRFTVDLSAKVAHFGIPSMY